jgi:hypothetical protein
MVRKHLDILIHGRDISRFFHSLEAIAYGLLVFPAGVQLFPHSVIPIPHASAYTPPL